MKENVDSIIDSKDKGKGKRNIGSKLSDFKTIEKIGKIEKVESFNLIYIKKEIDLSKYKSLEEKNKFKRQIKSLEYMNHQNLIDYYSSFEENNNLYIIMEYASLGNVNNLIIENNEKKEYIEEKKIWLYLIQCIRSLIYLYEVRKVIHGNIKRENILIDYDKSIQEENKIILKITDYGIKSIEGQNIDYYLKEDMSMIGKIFYNLMNNSLNDENEYEIEKLPYYYAHELRDFIMNLIKSDIAPKELFTEAMIRYNNKFLDFTSLYSSLLCLKNIPNFFSDLNKDVELILKKNENNIKENYPFIELLIELIKSLKNINTKYFKKELIKKICIKLRIFFYINYLDKSTVEKMIPTDFLSELFKFIHKTFNDYRYLPKVHNQISNEKKEENNINNSIKSIVESLIKDNKSIIYDLFYYIKKITNKCKKCNFLKYSYNINFYSILYPDKAATYLGRKKLNINDLFKHYRKERLYEDETCNVCKEYIYKTKIFYNSPIYLFLKIDEYDEKEIELNIEEKFNILEDVENIDIMNTMYHLIAVIFNEKTDDQGKKYSSKIKCDNNEWFYFDGNSMKKYYSELINHKKIELLLYSRVK